MKVVVEILFSLPTGIFTVALAFCLSWWISSFFLGGLDHGSNHGGQSTHGGAEHSHIGGRNVGRASAQASGARTGRLAKSSGKARRTLSNAAVPASLRWTVAAATAWSVSLLGSAVIGVVADAGTARRVALGVLALAAAFVGRSSTRGFARLVTPIFAAPDAPNRSALVGSHARVRSLEVTQSHGEAKVIDGKSAGAIVRVRTTGPQQAVEQGAVIQLVSFDPDAEVYLVDLAEPDVVGW
jgi:hypothetical protein